jgi:DNA-binding NarL/FixJ family response regulator
VATRPRVLLAEDHPGVAKALSRLLAFDCDVVGVVGDGGEIVAAAARPQPVIVVADVNLPTVSGLDVCRAIVRTNPHARVILMTGMVDEAIAEEAVAAGASGFFPKFASGDELLAAIKRLWTELEDDGKP